MINDDLFDRFQALTFDDVVIIPGYSDVLPDTVDTAATTLVALGLPRLPKMTGTSRFFTR